MTLPAAPSLWIAGALALAVLSWLVWSARRPTGAGRRQPVPLPEARPGDTGARSGAATRERAPPVRETGRPENPRDALLAARSWGYQLQKLDIRRAASSPFDVLVIDYSRDGSDERALKPAEIARLKARPEGASRLVLAYLSIGEAESYRYYWDNRWTAERPRWLLSENPDWRENYAVCFWDTDWQRVICGSPSSYLDKIVAAGFDGVYLDKCDVFEDIERRERKAARARSDLERDMVDFVVRLSAHARTLKPDFLVVMQNAEPLLEHEALLAAIDGAAKEELLYGLAGPQRRNAKDEITFARRALDRVKRAGKAVLVVEYLDDEAKIAEAARYSAEAAFNLYIAPKDRELDRLNYVVLEA